MIMVFAEVYLTGFPEENGSPVRKKAKVTRWDGDLIAGEKDMLIYKNDLPEDTLDFVKIELPAKDVQDAAKLILKVDLQYGSPKMWYQADAEGAKKVYTIIAIGTGHPWGDVLTKENYIGSLSLMEGTLVLHYFIIEGDFLGDLLEGLGHTAQGEQKIPQ